MSFTSSYNVRFNFLAYQAVQSDLDCSYFDEKYEYQATYAKYVLEPQKNYSGANRIVIVGGLGRVGIQIANQLLLDGFINIHLCGRSKLSIEEIKTRLSSSSELLRSYLDGKICYHATNSADEILDVICDDKQFADTLIFCASSSDKDSIRLNINELELKDLYEQMQPKISLYNELISSERSLTCPRIIFISSNASRLSGPGLTAYAYSSALVDKQVNQTTTIVSSICFDAFRFTQEPSNTSGLLNFADETGLYNALKLTLQSDIGINLILSNEDFSLRIQKWVRKKVNDYSDIAVSNPNSTTSNIRSTICEIFREILGREKFTHEDNFFSAGGHSLLAFRALGRINSAYKIRITLRDLTLNPSPMELSKVVSQKKSQSASLQLNTEHVNDINELLAKYE